MALPVTDEDRYRLTSCYAAGRCQGDLGCPRWLYCYRSPYLDEDDGYDDEGW